MEKEDIMDIFRDKQQKMISELISKVLNLETQNEMLKDINNEMQKENERLKKEKGEGEEKKKSNLPPRKSLGGRQ